MQLTISSEFEPYIQAKLESGKYRRAEDVVAEALSLLAARDIDEAERRAAMDQFIEEGIRSGNEEGWLTPEEVEVEMDTLLTELRKPHD